MLYLLLVSRDPIRMVDVTDSHVHKIRQDLVIISYVKFPKLKKHHHLNLLSDYFLVVSSFSVYEAKNFC